MKLYEINRELEKILDEIESRGGEMTPLEESLIESLEIAFDDKVKAIVYIISRENARMLACDAEIKRVSKLMSSSTNKITWLKNYLTGCLKGANYDGGTFLISYRSSTSTEVDLGVLPQKYIRTKIETSADKEMIKADLKANIKVPGAFLVHKKNIQIK